MNPQFFPVVLIVLDVLASIAYAIEGDIRRSIYWAAAATLTVCITI